MKQKVRTLLSGQIPVAIIFFILGLCLIFVPAATFNVISKVVFGLALIFSGLYHVVSYVFPRKGTESSALDLYPGVISMVLGIFLFTNPQLVRVLLPWVLGAFLVADCVWMLKGALQMRKHGIAMWEVLVAVSAIFIILGIVLVVNPFAQVKTMLSFAGWLLVIKAILDLILYIQLKKKLDVALAMQAQKTKKTESYAMATVEPQRPAAPSFWQKREQKKQEKEAARAKAREAARLREEQERAERNRRAQEQERAEEEEVFAGTNAMHDASTEEPMDADFAQTEATEHEVGGSEPIYDAHYTEADVDEDGEEG